MPKAKWSVRGREWHGGSLGEDMAWTVCVYHSTHTPTGYSTYLYLSTYMYVYVSFRESGTKSKAASLPQGPMQSAYMICPSNTTLFAEGSRAAADDIPAGSIGSLAGHTA